jgi:small subunit ribosomal protein S9
MNAMDDQNPSEQTQTQGEQATTAVATAPEAAAGQPLPELTFAAAGAEQPQESAAPVVRGKIDRFGVAMGTGRRKTAVARVRIQRGNGKMTVNNRTLEDYFPVERDRLMIEAPLKTTDSLGKVDIWVRVSGGGPTGQAGAVILGIARALQALNPDLHHALADGGFLTRDGRMVERKKYGFKKARRSFQFSKR